MVGAEHLPQEHPEGDQRGEHPVQPAANSGQRFGDDPLGEDVGERQIAVLEELAAQETRLFAERPRVGTLHRSGLRAGEKGLSNPIFTRKAPSAYLPSAARLAKL